MELLEIAVEFFPVNFVGRFDADIAECLGPFRFPVFVEMGDRLSLARPFPDGWRTLDGKVYRREGDDKKNTEQVRKPAEFWAHWKPLLSVNFAAVFAQLVP